MKASQLIVACILCQYLLGAYSFYVWPKPAVITQGSGSGIINPTSFQVTTTSTSNILKRAIQRYNDRLFFPMGQGNPPSGSFALSSLVIQVQFDDEDLQLGVNESYTLTLLANNSTAEITAVSVFGALRGLETFSQLIDYDDATATYSINCFPTSISDTPRFPWRGLLIDTARHYLDPSTIFRTIDALSYSKFNTLHWHIVDAESFPIVSLTYPNLSAAGAYAPSAIYPQPLVKSIVEYAKERGIRVVPEFDIPGHAYSWGKGYPDLTVSCPNYQSNINNVPLNPTLNSTYDMLSQVIPEMASLFYDNYFHIGGDEVVYGCWEDNTEVVNWMNQNGYTATQTLQYFEDNLQPIVEGAGKSAVCWEDLYDDGVDVPSNYIIEVWDNQATLQSVVKAGYRAITAYGFYLNNQEPVPGQTTSQWVDTWKIMFANDPLDDTNLTPAEVDLVLGGEAAMWGEQVDSVNYDSRVWPRACAVSERLWSPQSDINQSDATNRLIEHRCRLARRGIGAGPIAPDYCSVPYTPYVGNKA